jgi:hypothetical protein
MEPTMYEVSRIWFMVHAIIPSDMGSGAICDAPTHNIIRNFATVNGLPIWDDPTYDYNAPWENLEPRFYKFIAKDGDKINNMLAVRQYLETFSGGCHHSSLNPGTPTGYYQKKFNALGPDLTWDMLNQLVSYIPFLRLADVYLMYAEAVNFQTNGGPQAHSSNYGLTAEEAINKVRNRAQLPDIAGRYTADRDVFFEEIVRERAVELFMEGARFCDLRRWNRNGDDRYLNKTSIDFDRNKDGKPINIWERVLIRRKVEKKHNWLPIQPKHVNISKTFPQNPGW